MNCRSESEVVFMNPVNKTLKDGRLSVSGSGLLDGELEYRIPDLKPNCRVRVQFWLVPYRSGQKTLVANLDCAMFRNIKASCTVDVRP